jgi:hypothetical protein
MRELARQRTVTLGEVLMHQPHAMNEARGSVVAAAESAPAPTLTADLDVAWADITNATVPIRATTTHSSKAYQQREDSKSSWALLPAAVRAFGVEGTKSAPTRLQSWFGTSAKPSNWQDTPTHGNPKEAAPICT